jgi:hypothetical protein
MRLLLLAVSSMLSLSDPAFAADDVDDLTMVTARPRPISVQMSLQIAKPPSVPAVESRKSEPTPAPKPAKTAAATK